MARDWSHRSNYGPPPDIPMVAMDFCFVNTESDDDMLTILAMKEKTVPISWCDSASGQISERVCGRHDHRMPGLLGKPTGHDKMRSRAEHEANRRVASGTERTKTDDC